MMHSVEVILILLLDVVAVLLPVESRWPPRSFESCLRERGNSPKTTKNMEERSFLALLVDAITHVLYVWITPPDRERNWCVAKSVQAALPMW